MAKKRDTGLLLSRALDDAERARNELRTARGDLRRYKGKAAKTRARNRIATAEHKLTLAERRVNKYADEAEREEGPPETTAKEWELGFNYEGSAKRGQAVMINARIFRKGGGLVTEREARDVIRYLHEGGKPQRLPHGLAMHAVNWTRGTPANPGKKSGERKASELEAFQDMWGTFGVDAWSMEPHDSARLSPVEDEEDYE